MQRLVRLIDIPTMEIDETDEPLSQEEWDQGLERSRLKRRLERIKSEGSKGMLCDRTFGKSCRMKYGQQDGERLLPYTMQL